jgi:hypothetical protein
MQHVGCLINSTKTTTESAYDVQLLKKISAYTWQDLNTFLFLKANYRHMLVFVAQHGNFSGVIKISKYSS